MPKLHRAKTVAWGLLRSGRCCMIVVSHWSKPAWQNMASLLAVVVGYRTPHRMPYGGKFHHLIFKKPPLVRGVPPGAARRATRGLGWPYACDSSDGTPPGTVN